MAFPLMIVMNRDPESAVLARNGTSDPLRLAKEVDRPGESYGIGLGGDCGLS
jgi:hypothetical protein